MTRLILSLASLSLLVACGSNSSTSTASKTNVNAANKIPYANTENAYSLAQRVVEFAPLEDFVGKTASEMKLWEMKDIVVSIRQLMGPEYSTMVKFWNTETPMKKFGDVLMLSGCERDNCVDNRYVIIMSLSEGLLSIVHIDKASIREWQVRRPYSIQPLPPPFKEELEEMKLRN